MSGKAAYESVSSAFVPLLVTGVLFMNQCRWRWLDSHSQTKTNANLNSSTERRQCSKRLWGFKAPSFSLECYIPRTPADESWKHLFQRGLEVLPARPFSLLFAGPKELPTNLDGGPKVLLFHFFDWNVSYPKPKNLPNQNSGGGSSSGRSVSKVEIRWYIYLCKYIYIYISIQVKLICECLNGCDYFEKFRVDYQLCFCSASGIYWMIPPSSQHPPRLQNDFREPSEPATKYTTWTTCLCGWKQRSPRS